MALGPVTTSCLYMLGMGQYVVHIYLLCWAVVVPFHVQPHVVPRGALWKPILARACAVAASRSGLCCSCVFHPCDVLWLVESYSVYLYIQDLYVNLVSKFCPSWSCFPSLPTPINKSSHPSFFDWNKIDPRAAQRCLCCIPFGWGRQLPRNSSCPA